MSLFNGVLSVSGITFVMFAILLIAAVGYALGRITVKGISLGTAGVFVVALLFGALFYGTMRDAVVKTLADGTSVDISTEILKVIENLGLVLFVSSIGFIAGPRFLSNLRTTYKYSAFLGVVITLMSGIICIFFYWLGVGSYGDAKEFAALLVGLWAGALSSTSAFSAAKATVAAEFESAVTVGYGITYLFGVIGIVLFIQILPKLLGADMEKERRKLPRVEVIEKNTDTKRRFELDPYGIGAFSLASFLGVLLGAVKIPLTSAGLEGATFSLTTTGGVLVVSLLFGHFGHIGPVSIMIKNTTAKVFRELGLTLFLIGAGVAGGARFVEYFKPVYFFYGAVMTVLPMIVGFLFAKYLLKLSLLNNLGSIAGGMTSTPALGTLISVSKTEDVAAAYAAAYPIALIAVVLTAQALSVLLV